MMIPEKSLLFLLYWVWFVFRRHHVGIMKDKEHLVRPCFRQIIKFKTPYTCYDTRDPKVGTVNLTYIYSSPFKVVR